MSYKFRARDRLGKIQEGTLEVEDRDEATESLTREGLSVLTLEESDDDDDLPLISRGVSQKDVIYTASQLAIMVDTGITLSSALESLRRQEGNPRLKAVLGELKSHVEAGEDFSAALARFPKHFDKTFVALVKASEQTGTLGQMLERISNYLRTDMETRGKVKAALAYPGIMLCVAIGVTAFLLTYVMPKFTPLFQKRGMKLPTPTIVLMALSESIINYWYIWLASLVALIVAFLYFRTTGAGRRAIDWLKINFPVTGTMIRKVIISRSIRTLGTMVKSGVSMLEALKLTAEVSGNAFYREAWLGVVDQVTDGRKICDALEGNQLFPTTLVQMISSGEETGRLDEVLEKVSSFYDRELELHIKTTTSLIEPVMIVVMGFVVGGIAMSLLLPIFQLSRPMKH
jgi:type IV pilus assembly protein PilC